MDVLESEYLLQTRLASVVAFASLHSSPKADFEKGAQQAVSAMTKAMGAIPYMMAGGRDDPGLNKERQEAIRKFHELQKRTPKVT